MDKSSKPTIRLLFATKGCAISHSLLLLTGQISTEPLYVVSYTWTPDLDDVFVKNGREEITQVIPTKRPREVTENDEENQIMHLFCSRDVNVIFYLIGGFSTGDVRSRVWPIFFCCFKTQTDFKALYKALWYGAPLNPHVISDTLCISETFDIHSEVIQTLMVTTHHLNRKGLSDNGLCITEATLCKLVKKSVGRQELTSLYAHYERQVLAAYRRLYWGYGCSPFWYIVRFGPSEKTLVLATRYYLLQTDTSYNTLETPLYDLQAIKDLFLTYQVPALPNRSGYNISDLLSFDKLSMFCCSSTYTRGLTAKNALSYILQRIHTDTTEIHAVSEYITNDRKGLKVPDREFVDYIYLAHFECFNRKQIADHLQAVTYSDFVNKPVLLKSSNLGKRATANFFNHVRSRLNMRDYIKKNVICDVTELGPEIGHKYTITKTYTLSLTYAAKPSKFIGVCDLATTLTRRVENIEKQFSPYGWSSTIPSNPPGFDELSNFEDSVVSAEALRAANFANDTPNQSGRTGFDTSPGITKLLLFFSAATGIATHDVSILSYKTPLEALIGHSEVTGPMPVYRVALPQGAQAFAVIANDTWSSITNRYTLPHEARLIAEDLKQINPCNFVAASLRDMQLTLLLSTSVKNVSKISSNIPKDQLYINRNELFNTNLIITNLILDVDFHIRKPIPLGILHAGMRAFRHGILTAMQLLFPKAVVNPNKDPCYFYKTACPEPTVEVLDDDNLLDITSHSDIDFYIENGELYTCVEENYTEDVWFFDTQTTSEVHTHADVSNNENLHETLPCNCKEKIGFRVCVPIPNPYALVGSSTLKGFAQILQQAVLLEREFVEYIGPYLRDFSFIDTGVYSHGHSLRLPFFSKVTTTGTAVGQLLPFYVVPEQCIDILAFVTSHRNPANFHFHSRPQSNVPVQFILHNLGGEYAEFFERKVARNKQIFSSPQISLTKALKERGVTCLDAFTLEAFVDSTILESIVEHIAVHFPGRDREYTLTSSKCIAIKRDWVLFQLICGTKGFTCLRYPHRGGRTAPRTFVSLRVDHHNRLCISLAQQCFATKCDSNRMHTIFTLEVPNYPNLTSS
uniref:ORF6 n=1 Tax=Human herpesvirus 3 TaxID=10335 RepID=A0A4D6FAH9_HHV3|nr:ORF6 [Human alphaherpesvirus 3]